MNEITIISSDSGLTMSSLEIAAYAGKRHDNVVRDIKKMLRELGDGNVLNFEGVYTDAKGEARPCFNLPKRETLILVSGYDVRMRAKIIDRWAELEAAVALASSGSGNVTALDAEVRKVIGGILKSVVHKELTETLPTMVRAQLAVNTTLLRSGKTSGEIWSQFGLPKIKNAPTWLGNRLAEMGCAIENGGRVEVGGRKFRLFDPDKSAICMKNGLHHKAKVYASERMGQGKLRLVGGDDS
jgi:Rha family phage regulatory protein